MFNNSNLFNNSKYGNVLTVILVIAIIAIIGIIVIVGYNIYRKYAIEKGAQEAISQFENLIGDGNAADPNSTVGEISGIDETGGITTSANGKKTQYKGFDVIGTIEIPKIKLKYPVLQKVTKKSLETSVAHLYAKNKIKIITATIGRGN